MCECVCQPYQGYSRKAYENSPRGAQNREEQKARAETYGPSTRMGGILFNEILQVGKMTEPIVSTLELLLTSTHSGPYGTKLAMYFFTSAHILWTRSTLGHSPL
jgi:hypothetical protein